MVSTQQKSFRVLRFARCESVISVNVTFVPDMMLILLQPGAEDYGTIMFNVQVVSVNAEVESVLQDMLAKVC